MALLEVSNVAPPVLFSAAGVIGLVNLKKVANQFRPLGTAFWFDDFARFNFYQTAQ